MEKCVTTLPHSNLISQINCKILLFVDSISTSNTMLVLRTWFYETVKSWFSTSVSTFLHDFYKPSVWISGSLYSFVCLPAVIKFSLTGRNKKNQFYCPKDVHDEATAQRAHLFMLKKSLVLHHSIHFLFSSHDTFFWSLFSSSFSFSLSSCPFFHPLCCTGKQECKNLWHHITIDSNCLVSSPGIALLQSLMIC